MAQIFDPVPYPMQRSLTGTPLDSAVPGQYFDPADMARRQAANTSATAAAGNPNFPRNHASASKSYLADGLSYDIEGLLRSVALKYGVDAAKQLVAQLPTMSREQLMAVQKLVGQAANESDSMSERERMAYERAGMRYSGGKYVP